MDRVITFGFHPCEYDGFTDGGGADPSRFRLYENPNPVIIEPNEPEPILEPEPEIIEPIDISLIKPWTEIPPAKSNSIEYFRYDDGSLYVYFFSPRPTYVYFDVPLPVLQDLITARNTDEFFWRNIKGKGYKYDIVN